MKPFSKREENRLRRFTPAEREAYLAWARVNNPEDHYHALALGVWKDGPIEEVVEARPAPAAPVAPATPRASFAPKKAPTPAASVPAPKGDEPYAGARADFDQLFKMYRTQKSGPRAWEEFCAAVPDRATFKLVVAHVERVNHHTPTEYAPALCYYLKDRVFLGGSNAPGVRAEYVTDDQGRVLDSAGNVILDERGKVPLDETGQVLGIPRKLQAIEEMFDFDGEDAWLRPLLDDPLAISTETAKPNNDNTP